MPGAVTRRTQARQARQARQALRRSKMVGPSFPKLPPTRPALQDEAARKPSPPRRAPPSWGFAAVPRRPARVLERAVLHRGGNCMNRALDCHGAPPNTSARRPRSCSWIRLRWARGRPTFLDTRTCWPWHRADDFGAQRARPDPRCLARGTATSFGPWALPEGPLPQSSRRPDAPDPTSSSGQNAQTGVLVSHKRRSTHQGHVLRTESATTQKQNLHQHWQGYFVWLTRACPAATASHTA